MKKVSKIDPENDGRPSLLVRYGIVQTRRAAPPQTLFSQRPPRAKAGASAVKALLEERWRGR